MARINRKIRGATVCKAGRISFKSKLEMRAYGLLKQLGLKPLYERKVFELIEPFESATPFYDKETDAQRRRRIADGDKEKGRLLARKSRKAQATRYTPDFYFRYKDVDVYIETKGFENDVFPVKRKLFRRLLDRILEKTGRKSVFFEIHTLRQLEQAINILKDGEY